MLKLSFFQFNDYLPLFLIALSLAATLLWIRGDILDQAKQSSPLQKIQKRRQRYERIFVVILACAAFTAQVYKELNFEAPQFWFFENKTSQSIFIILFVVITFTVPSGACYLIAKFIEERGIVRRGGFTWDFSNNYLALNGPRSTLTGEQHFHVTGFQVKVKNNTNKHFKKISGTLRSSTGEEIPILLESRRPEETNGIPARAEFWLKALFYDPNNRSSGPEGMPEKEFLKRFPEFKLTFNYDANKFVKKFGRNKVSRFIHKYIDGANQPVIPGVTYKA